MSDKVDQRNKRILDAALSLASERGFRQFSRNDVAERAGVAAGSVNNAYGTMDDLHDAVMAAAVERADAKVVSQGLAIGHPAAKGAPQELKDSALALLAA